MAALLLTAPVSAAPPPSSEQARQSVDVDVAPKAKLGKHDVAVTLGTGDKLLAKQAFVVAVPLDASVSGGKAEQGGLVRVSVSNRDTVAFDTQRFTLLPLIGQGEPSLVPVSNQSFCPSAIGTIKMSEKRIAPSMPKRRIGWSVISAAASLS